MGFDRPNPPIFLWLGKKDSAQLQSVDPKPAKTKTALCAWEKILPYTAHALTEGGPETSELADVGALAGVAASHPDWRVALSG